MEHLLEITMEAPVGVRLGTVLVVPVGAVEQVMLETVFQEDPAAVAEIQERDPEARVALVKETQVGLVQELQEAAQEAEAALGAVEPTVAQVAREMAEAEYRIVFRVVQSLMLQAVVVVEQVLEDFQGALAVAVSAGAWDILLEVLEENPAGREVLEVVVVVPAVFQEALLGAAVAQV